MMKKVLAYLVIGAILVLAGCAFGEKDSQPKPSVLEKLPFVHKMTVQQGNIVTEEMIDRLELGMTKSQARFLLGTPMLTDLFHTDRWDYTYTIRRGHDKMMMMRLTLLFEADRLVEVQGDLRPDPNRAAQRQPADLLVSVPDWQDDRGLFTRLLLDPESTE
ncbi:outer membrane protein assembly factor BamE [Candidatus Thiosymbion oneisti]|uniref:outer membrane protein assembly factor BamE n=1 Tax=Candidatus Thiosymbion oneisti TaxID=589554 RepID=UPI00311CD2DE